MKYKRILSCLLAVVMCMSVTGCSKDKGGDKKTTSAATVSVKDIIPEKVEVVETLGDLDLSDYIIETGVSEDFKIEVEAEDGTCFGNASDMNYSFMGAFSGDGFVGGIDNAESGVECEMEFPAKGSYTISVVVAGDKSNETGIVTVDGVKTGTFKMEKSGTFAECVVEMVSIDEGTHKVGVTFGTTPVYVDKITVTPGATVDVSQYEVSKVLSNPDASDNTKRLYNFLTDVYGKYIISGNYASESGASGGLQSREFKEIMRNTGEYPAIMGLDLIELSPSRVAHGSNSNVLLYALEWDRQGGIVSLCWHWNAPEDYLEVNGKAWWEGFYTEATSFNLRAALDGTDPNGYDLILRDIDAIAEHLKTLEELDVPILWRPLHEAGGDPKWNNPWFWWGSSGADCYKELWTLLYDRLTNYHNIDNLIWVWNAQNVSWYPGDEYVDIISYDIYADEHDTTSQKEIYDYIKGSTSTSKIIALSENGVIPDPDACMADGTRWSWFSVWNGEFTIKDAQLSGQYTPLEMWNKVYTHDRVLTLDELPDLKSYPINTDDFLANQ